ncbi:N-acetylmuramic acid 6-phosphate etherase [Clostridioides difficile]|uniref:N-acetylmuramic acid 6-phosphate etherase n=3 Tax=Clostridioides difficile TaxID=1496 RepID=A0A9R0BMQ3_CLODR|nr:N-acetylmuramic acid 6-phosphate etherase [Clostridioides difficile]OFT99445.1 N-acetylmuramic acid 6-phosphate etherase [Clostridium sp. HMSC19E03]OFU16752.1 N-acetylmuramic acid 6-phosphate etherase [Clostridium sp. HMSC19C08]OFU20281.1 N-acetylmuramic acid 6-phosphate etherase [Clostridium sp. HMSC19C05]OFU22440.1 N-acetylmuramic acid 6-phosphate etherase [Clostridium sp. HMSC19C09]OFU32308.1 N-acetylmuramic acid 6-phosphate etherase [Clostridium sp. HMSC19B10]OFU46472.1 N-acetylmuramic
MLIKTLENLVTEGRNKNTLQIDKEDTLGIIELINNEDKTVAYAVEEQKESIAKAVNIIVDRMKQGGRLFYIGAGTSGRIGILDATECPPTYGVDFELVQAIIAGGNQAIFKAIEGAEDDKELGKQDIIDRGVTSKDVICGIAASGRTPYVIGAMEYAKELGCAVLSITMNPNSEMSKKADLPINIIVGAEVIMGSTRMKSGTAQKMVCNMLTTASMVKMGKVYSNLMVDVKTSNEKLVERAKRIIMIATNVKYDVAEKFLEEADNRVKLAIFMIKSGLDKDSAKSILDRQEGYISEALKSIEKL